MKKDMLKRIIRFMLVFAIVLGVFPLPGTSMEARADDPEGYSVTLIGGSHATPSGGSTTQLNLTGAMTTVTYTAEDGFRFAKFDTIVRNGIEVIRINNSTVKVQGTPTGDSEIVVPDAVSSLSYLTFTGTSDFTIKTENGSKNWNGTIEYSTDLTTWATWSGSQISSDNKVLYLRGSGNKKITGEGYRKNWKITPQGEGKVSCSGDIRTLLNYLNPDDTRMDKNCFAYLFDCCTCLDKAPSLPATTLADSCYYSMFNACTSLSEAPSLPAITLTEYCYSYMFEYCTSLEKTPALPATTLAISCYQLMFYCCEGLSEISKLPAITMKDLCYESMF